MAEIEARRMGAVRGGPVARPEMPEPPRTEGVAVTFYVSADTAYRLNAELQRRNALNPRAPSWTLPRLMEEMIREKYPAAKK